eukprot:GHVS01059972.1.p1 GENE.GHVS01059972.1~~GHVS01059972.1.p1  ORF type:complete len:323 (-),score=58.46 GHVS01059972.1:78-971(-)
MTDIQQPKKEDWSSNPPALLPSLSPPAGSSNTSSPLLCTTAFSFLRFLGHVPPHEPCPSSQQPMSTDPLHPQPGSTSSSFSFGLPSSISSSTIPYVLLATAGLSRLFCLAGRGASRLARRRGTSLPTAKFHVPCVGSNEGSRWIRMWRETIKQNVGRSTGANSTVTNNGGGGGCLGNVKSKTNPSVWDYYTMSDMIVLFGFPAICCFIILSSLWLSLYSILGLRSLSELTATIRWLAGVGPASSFVVSWKARQRETSRRAQQGQCGGEPVVVVVKRSHRRRHASSSDDQEDKSSLRQ